MGDEVRNDVNSSSSEVRSDADSDPDTFVERYFVINLFSKVTDINHAHSIARQIVERLDDLSDLLLASTTVTVEEPVSRLLIRPTSN